MRREFVEAAEAWLRDAFGGGRWTVAVGAEGDRLCGCLFLERVDKVPDPGAIERAWGYLTNAYVAPEHRGRGIGGKLLERLVQVARTDALEFLIVWPSPEAVSFYERVGFIATAARHAGPDDHAPLELTVAG